MDKNRKLSLKKKSDIIFFLLLKEIKYQEFILFDINY